MLENWTTDQVGFAQAGASALDLALRAPVANMDSYRETTVADFRAAAAAGFRRDNEIIALFNHLDEWGTAAAADTAERLTGNATPADWNPYRHILDNWDEQRRERAARWIHAGLFNNVSSPRHLERVENSLLEYERDTEAMDRSGWGGTLGSLGGGIASPTTYIGGALVRGPSILASIGRMAAVNAAGSAVQEGILHQVQPLRTLRESVMNVGVAGVLGGGVGALAHAASRASPIHPSRADNPLRPENYPTHGEARLPGDETGDPIPGGYSSIGADVVEGTERSVWFGPAPERIGGDTANASTGWLTGRTLAGRALNYASDTARRAMSGLMEISAYSRTDLDGFARRASAEARRDVMLEDWQIVRGQVEEIGARLDNELAAIGAPRSRPDDVNFALTHALNQLPDTPDTWSAMVSRYGEAGAERVKAAGRDAAEQVHRLNEKFEARLRDVGALRDEKRLAPITQSVERLRADREAKLKEIQTRVDALTEQAKKAEAGDAREALLRQRDQTRMEMEDVRREAGLQIDRLGGELKRERSKPEALGRNYGMAQLWDRRQVVARQEEFRGWLTKVLAKDVDGDWLRETHGIERAELDRLALEEPGRYQQIVSEYGADGHDFHVRQLDLRVEALRAREKEARLDLNAALRSMGHADRLADSSERSVARLVAKEEEAALASARAERDAIDRTRKAIDAALTEAADPGVAKALRQDLAGQTPESGDFFRLDAALARLDEAHASRLPEAQAATATRQEAENRLTALRDALDRTPRADKETATRIAADADRAARDFERAVRKEHSLHAELEATNGRLTAVAKRTADLIEDRPLSRAERVKRLTETRADLDRARLDAEARAAKAAERLDLLTAARQRATDLHAKRKAAAETLTGVRNRKGVMADVAKDQLAKTEAAVASAVRKGGLNDVVDNIMASLSEGRVLRDGGLDDAITETGRVKERRINLTPEERAEAMRLGFLRDDVQNVLDLQYRQITGHIALREAMSIGEGPKFQYRSFEEITRQINADYAEKMQGVTDPKARGALENERAAAVRDLRAAKDRLLDRTNPGLDRDGWLYWTSQKMRQYNFLRFGPGMLVSSLMDTATFALRHSLSKDFVPHLREIVATMKGKANPELAAAVRAAEPVMFGLNRFDHTDPADLLDGLGIGASGSVKHQVTSKIDLMAQHATRYAGLASGLSHWGRLWKTAAAVSMQHKLGRMVTEYGSLSKFERADLASLGIGKIEAERIARLVAEHGSTVDGRFDPGIDDWHKSPGSDMAARDWRLAISRDLRRANIAPGIGDTPLLMDHAFGKLLMQFQTFAFATLNRYVVPMAQRVAYMDGAMDPKVYVSMANLFGLTAVSLALKDAARGKDPMERWGEDHILATTREIVDRSGLLGWAAPYINGMLQMTGATASSRYAQNQWWETLLGVNYGLVSQAARTAASVSADGFEQGEWNKVRDKVVNVAPFVFWGRVGNTILQHHNGER